MLKSTTMALAIMVFATPVLAAGPSQINALAKDWAATTGALQSLIGASDHVSQGLQALAKQYQETDAALTAEREYWKRYVEGLSAPK